jgi:hypothetical protein
MLCLTRRVGVMIIICLSFDYYIVFCVFNTLTPLIRPTMSTVIQIQVCRQPKLVVNECIHYSCHKTSMLEELNMVAAYPEAL